MIKDAQGHAVSGATADAIVPYDQAVRAFNLVYGDSIALFDAAREAAPDFVMAHLAKAWVFTLALDPGLKAPARGLLQTASGMAMNDRERAHLAALRHAVDGGRAAAVAVLDTHLMHYPFDIVAHEAATLLDGFLGRFPWVRARTARALPLWSSDRPGYGTMLAFHGFGMEEAGDYARAEDISREAAEREPHSFWPHHTVAHVMEMTGRPQDGLGWMAAREALWSSPDHVNRVHIWWHRSLFHVELGQYDEALALHDGPMRESQRRLGVSLTNASALLWRLNALGCDVSGRWRHLADLWDGHADGECLTFTDIHAAMAEIGAGQDARVEDRLGWMRATAASGNEAAPIYRDVGIPVVEAMRAFHRGAYEQTVAQLLPVRVAVWQIGGSHAQRDIVDWTLTEAALRGGQRDVALALAHERLGGRPRSVVNRSFLRRAEAITA